MKNILDMLFIKNVELDKDKFRNLYYSSDKSNFAGFNIEIIEEYKKFNEYEVIQDIINNIGEYHKEYKGFILLDKNKYFIRILEDNDSKIYDIMIHKLKNEEEYDKYNRIFFPKKIIIPNELKNINKSIIYVDNHVNIIKNEGLFSNYLGYEDWDYKNKCLNMIDVSTSDNIIDDFKNKDFNKEYIFKKNGGDLIKLKLFIKYYDGFYYIEDIKK